MRKAADPNCLISRTLPIPFVNSDQCHSTQTTEQKTPKRSKRSYPCINIRASLDRAVSRVDRKRKLGFAEDIPAKKPVAGSIAGINPERNQTNRKSFNDVPSLDAFKKAEDNLVSLASSWLRHKKAVRSCDPSLRELLVEKLAQERIQMKEEANTMQRYIDGNKIPKCANQYALLVKDGLEQLGEPMRLMDSARYEEAVESLKAFKERIAKSHDRELKKLERSKSRFFKNASFDTTLSMECLPISINPCFCNESMKHWLE